MTFEIDVSGHLARLRIWQRQHEGALRTLDALPAPAAPLPESAYSNWPDIVADVCARHGVTLEQMRARRGRRPGVILAAQELAWLLRRNGRMGAAPLPLPFIGRIVQRTHVTVMHSIKVHERRQRRSQPFYRQPEDSE